MKKILIFSHALEIGGAERALLGLLEAIDKIEYRVDLFLMRHSGELMSSIPKGVNLLPEVPEYSCLAVPISTVLKRGRFGVAFGRYIGKKKAAKRQAELSIDDENDISLEYSHKYTLKYMPRIGDGEYDLAVSFLTPHYFVAEKVSAKKKVAWIHTDYSKVAVDTDSQLGMWDKYDNVVSISDSVTRSFLSVFPTLKEKIVLIENIMPTSCLEGSACSFSPRENGEMSAEGEVCLLSVGRFSHAKNFDSIPEICKLIIDKGITNLKWYLIGYGGDEDLIRRKIEEAGMEERIIILGKKDNPYPYVKACDIYVQPSRYEGKCVAVREAQMLHKPVVITDYATSASQLTDGYDGVIVPMDVDCCAEGIVSVIKDAELRTRLIDNTKQNDYSNAKEVEKLYRLIGNDR